MRLFVIRVQIGFFYRPSAVGHPGAFLKINLIEWRTHPCPMTGGPPEIMQPCSLERIVFLASSFAVIGILYLVLVFKAPAFKQDDLLRPSLPVECHTDPCGSCTNYAEVAFNKRIVRKVSTIGVHAGFRYLQGNKAHIGVPPLTTAASR